MSAGSRASLRRFAAFAPLVVATAAIAVEAVRAVLAKVGHPGAPLDDAYIHFQYARAIAELHPLRYQAGQPISTGATSLLWPAALAGPYALGLHGEAILWAAWALSFAALGALAYEAYALAEPLAGRAAALGAGAMTLVFGGLVWCAASGMEVVPFAWLIARATRRSAEWVEAAPEARTRRRFAGLLALAAAAPFMRPEGAITSLVVGGAVFLAPPSDLFGARSWRARAWSLAFVLVAVAPHLLMLALTGHATSSTAQVKLLAGNPYFSLVPATLHNARVLTTQILNGEVWSAEFLPKGGAPFAFAGLAALAFRGQLTRRRFRACAVLVLALSMFVPCAYVTFLWNRLRYLWPFAAGWFIGLACLARALGGLASRVDARAGATVTALLAGAFAGALSTRLSWVIADVAQSASGIDRQQVALGRWAREHLPETARIGVNDTGAIAYFSGRETFDVVGLTTASEGPFWVAGAASRLEHYERMHAQAPRSLPTHFIVYPEWMACPPVLGRPLHDAVVTDSTILGGQIMRAYEARYDGLGSGERPWTKTGRVVDALDVADLTSEAEHGYRLLGAHIGEQVAKEAASPGGAVVVDGGRTARHADRFTARLRPGSPALGVLRVEVTAPSTLHVRAGGQEIAAIVVAPGSWTEATFTVPADVAAERTAIEVMSEEAFTSFHYWFAAL